MRRCSIIALIILFVFGLLATTALAEPSVSLNPSYAQRNIGGKVRMHIVLDEVTGSPLLSTGAKISFNPSYVQVSDAQKYVAGKWEVWGMKGDDTTYTDPPIQIDNTNGTVTIIGGKLKGNPDVTGINTLIGYVVFDCIAGGGGHTTKVAITVELANPVPYNNFVREDATVDDANMNINTAQQLATICIVDPSQGAEACEADFDGNGHVTGVDFGRFRNAFGSAFGDPNYDPAADLDNNQFVTGIDFGVFREDFGRTDCPSCTP